MSFEISRYISLYNLHSYAKPIWGETRAELNGNIYIKLFIISSNSLQMIHWYTSSDSFKMTYSNCAKVRNMNFQTYQLCNSMHANVRPYEFPYEQDDKIHRQITSTVSQWAVIHLHVLTFLTHVASFMINKFVMSRVLIVPIFQFQKHSSKRKIW